MPYLKPVFSQYDHLRGHWINGYLKPEFDKIAAGYACGNCGEDYGGEYRTCCPVCRMEMPTTDTRVGAETPPEWDRVEPPRTDGRS